MAIGMTYDQYWYGDVTMTRAFYLAYKLHQKMVDEQAWMYGGYVLKALEATVGNVFREKGSQPAEYPSEPMFIKDMDIYKTKASIEKKEQDEALWAEAWMNSLVQAGKNWGKNKK